MKLRDYLQDTRESVRAFADRAGLKRSTVQRIVEGNTNCGVHIAEKIVVASRLEVYWTDLVVRNDGEVSPTATLRFEAQVPQSQWSVELLQPERAK